MPGGGISNSGVPLSTPDSRQGRGLLTRHSSSASQAFEEGQQRVLCFEGTPHTFARGCLGQNLFLQCQVG